MLCFPLDYFGNVDFYVLITVHGLQDTGRQYATCWKTINIIYW